jgi:hypothetical protein
MKLPDGCVTHPRSPTDGQSSTPRNALFASRIH